MVRLQSPFTMATLYLPGNRPTGWGISLSGTKKEIFIMCPVRRHKTYKDPLWTTLLKFRKENSGGAKINVIRYQFDTVWWWVCVTSVNSSGNYSSWKWFARRDIPTIWSGFTLSGNFGNITAFIWCLQSLHIFKMWLWNYLLCHENLRKIQLDKTSQLLW